jgi:chromosome segregation ATPase
MTGSRTAEVKRLENDLRNVKASLSKERLDAHTTRQTLQEEASRVTETAAKQVADIQSRLEKAKRDHADSQAHTASLLATHERRSTKNVRELQDSLTTHQRLIQEKNEECSRANSRAVQLEQQLTVAISSQQDLESNTVSLAREMEALRGAKREVTKKQRDAASRMSGLIQSEETRLRQLSEGRMENARLQREVQRLESALGRKSSRGSSRSPTRA